MREIDGSKYVRDEMEEKKTEKGRKSRESQIWPDCNSWPAEVVKELWAKNENSARNKSANSSQQSGEANLRAWVLEILRISNNSWVDAREKAEVKAGVDDVRGEQGHICREKKFEGALDCYQELEETFLGCFLIAKIFFCDFWTTTSATKKQEQNASG